MIFSAIKADDVVDLWPEIRVGLEDMLENHTVGRWTSNEVLTHLLTGEWQLFIVSDDRGIVASLVCNIVDGHTRTLEIGMCWGTGANDWSDEVNESLEQLAHELGCDQLALDGRPGWRNIMRKHDFELKSVTYVRRINGQY